MSEPAWVAALLSLRTVTFHTSAVRLCGLVYFFAFLGNVIDGPVMWLCLPLYGDYSADYLLWMNRLCLCPALLLVLRPWWWPLFLLCWWAWHVTQEHGGSWFYFGWDQMMDEIGFLAMLLSVTLTFYDDQAPVEAESPGNDGCEAVSAETSGAEPDESKDEHCEDSSLLESRDAGESLRARQTPTGGHTQAHREEAAGEDPPESKATGTVVLAPSSATALRRAWNMLWGVEPLGSVTLDPCDAVVEWSRTIAELSLTLAGFRLFLAAGLLKMRVGSACWENLTCLYDHFETQPMPNPAAWFMQNFMPLFVLRIMQFFAINLAELRMPYLLLGFLFSMGPIGFARKALLEQLSDGKQPWYFRLPLRFPARCVGSVIISIFVLGMFLTGNYAYLHPLSVISLIASMGTDRGVLFVVRGNPPHSFSAQAKVWYRKVAPWILIAISIWAFLPSFRAYAWLLRSTEQVGPSFEPVMRSSFVQSATDMNLGIPYNHHAYFAGAVHDRNEVVLFADVGEGWVEMDIPCKVGSVNRAPCFTSPLHRRFAWQWWFLGLGSDPTFLDAFLHHLCRRNEVAWNALEYSPAYERRADVKRLAAKMYSYHYTKPGERGWWTRTLRNVYSEVQCP